MRRLSFLLAAWLVALAWMADVAPCRAADAPAAPTTKSPATAVSLIGLSRAEVVALRGKPSGERRRGEVLVMVYPDGTRLELREDKVISASGAGGAQITASDGTQYAAGADGNIQRPVRFIEAAGPAEEDDAAGSAPAEIPPAPRVVETSQSEAPGGPKASSAARPAPAAASAAAEGDGHAEAGPDLPPGATPPPSVAAARAAAVANAQVSLADDEADAEHHESGPSTAVSVIGGIIGAVLHFGLTVLVLRIAVQVVGVPFFWPDLLKVALLYLAVYELAATLGKLGGLWEFLTIFRVHEVSSFLIMACALTWFKIAGSGLTALKIAVATKLVLTGLMLAIGLILAFGLGMIMR